ncbi:hypothetical protein B0H65DRAFT_548968 [Neurospora tetraspora]|uniref:Uncharacterized protein n=1 Tax=Neurospora tetraspora TaxID=94610 RepID=A0AAE0JFV7_9PEZI|nr:hypothetical protein B0H65DRAFT_548968 [Neurospora tetraspora]
MSNPPNPESLFLDTHWQAQLTYGAEPPLVSESPLVVPEAYHLKFSECVTTGATTNKLAGYPTSVYTPYALSSAVATAATTGGLGVWYYVRLKKRQELDVEGNHLHWDCGWQYVA